MKYLIILLLFIGCGSRKVEATNEKIKSENIDVDNSRTIRQEVNLDISPFDNSKPMIIDGKKYENHEVRIGQLEADKKEMRDDIKDIKKTNEQILILLQNKEDRK